MDGCDPTIYPERRPLATTVISDIVRFTPFQHARHVVMCCHVVQSGLDILAQQQQLPKIRLTEHNVSQLIGASRLRPDEGDCPRQRQPSRNVACRSAARVDSLPCFRESTWLSLLIATSHCRSKYAPGLSKKRRRLHRLSGIVAPSLSGFSGFLPGPGVPGLGEMSNDLKT